MDRHGILNRVTKLGRAMQDFKQAKMDHFDPAWRWHNDMLICPEIPCFACQKVMKTNIVMVYREATKTLVGQWAVQPEKLKVGPAYHTHAHGVSGSICLGNARSLMQLLYSPPNPHKMWAWDVKMIRWNHRYAQHDCPQMHTWWAESFPGEEYPWDGPFIKQGTKQSQKKSKWEVYGTEGELEIDEHGAVVDTTTTMTAHVDTFVQRHIVDPLEGPLR